MLGDVAKVFRFYFYRESFSNCSNDCLVTLTASGQHWFQASRAQFSIFLSGNTEFFVVVRFSAIFDDRFASILQSVALLCCSVPPPAKFNVGRKLTQFTKLVVSD